MTEHRELVINFLDHAVSLSTAWALIKDLCNLNNTYLVEIKIETVRGDEVFDTKYQMTDNLCTWLGEFIDCECPVKNGCQIYFDTDTNTYYYCLTDCHCYDKEGNDLGMEETRVYFREGKAW